MATTLRDRLAPGQLVAVVLVRPHEDHRAFLDRDAVTQAVSVVELGREAQSQHVHQLVDGAGRARAREHDRVALRVGPQSVSDDAPRLLPEARRLEARARRLGVGVGIARQDRGPDVVLDEAQATPRCRVVGVRDAARSEGSFDDLVVADDRRADELDEGVRFGIGECSHGPKRRVSHRRIVVGAGMGREMWPGQGERPTPRSQ